jgi:CelD/BcsL family acetyltransferase involved in cellulose biosynthesis
MLASNPSMIEVQEINQIEDLDAFRRVWHDLLERTAAASFFHSLEWLECYWKHFGDGQKLRVLVVSDRGSHVGILPLVVRPEATRVGRLRILTYPLHDWATYYSPIGPDPAATLTAGLRHIRQMARDWDVLDLRWIDADGGDLGRTKKAMLDTGFPPCGQKWDLTSLIDLPDSWQEYWFARPPKFRRNIDRLQRRIAEKGQTEFIRCRDGTRSDLYDACVSLAARSWQGDHGDKTSLCHGEFARFFRAAHAAASSFGATDISLLYFEGQAVAFCYNYFWNGVVYALRKGFDPRYAKLSPGLVLQKLMLEDGHRRGDRLYDFGTGDHHSKAAWRTSVRANYRFTYFPATVFRAQLLWWNRWLRGRLLGQRDIACST